MKWYRGKFDFWSFVHFFGSFFLAHLLMAFWGFLGIPVAFGLGILYEIICDGMLSRRISFFDSNGGSWSDVIADFVGCVLALFV